MSQTSADQARALRFSESGEIDLRQLVHVLWSYRRSMLVIAAVAGVLGVAISVLNTRYRSQGLFLTPGLSVENYKPFEASFNSRPRLEAFLRLSGQEDEPAAELVARLLEVPGALGEAVRPVFAFTDKDAKQFGVKADDAKIVGLGLALDEDDLSDHPPVRLLSEYVRDTRIKTDLFVALLRHCRDSERRAKELRSEQLASEFKLKQQNERASTLRRLVSQVPPAQLVESRQVVSLENGGERFLSPVTQLVAIEVLIAEIKLADEIRARDTVASSLRRDYYCEAHSELAADKVTGAQFLDDLARIQERVFSNFEQRTDVVEQTAIELDLQREGWRQTYLEGMRFVTAPESAQVKVRKPGLAVGAILGLVLGSVAGALLAFWRAWWRANRAAVVAED